MAPVQFGDLDPKMRMQRGNELSRHFNTVMSYTLVSWGVFMFVMLMTGWLLARLAVMVYLTLVCALAGSIVFGVVNAKGKAKGSFYKWLSILTGIGAVVGFVVGKRWISDSLMVQYWAPVVRPHYKGVSPVSPALAVADGGIITFGSGTKLDHQHALGLSVPLSGPRYCVAPIVGADAGAEVNFWAGGKDCCNHRGEFVCGDANDNSVVTGMVYTDATKPTAFEVAAFRKAIRQASAVYGLQIPQKPVVMIWAADVEDARWEFNRDSILTALALGAFSFIIFVGAATFIHMSTAKGRGGPLAMLMGT